MSAFVQLTLVDVRGVSLLAALSPLLLASGLFSGTELGFPVLAGLLSGVRQSLFRKRIAHYDEKLTLHCARKTSRSVCQI